MEPGYSRHRRASADIIDISEKPRLELSYESGRSGKGKHTFHGLPTSPILHTAIKDITLIQHTPDDRTIGPSVGFHDPLYQAHVPDEHFDPDEILELEQAENLSLYAHIPDLGVAVVGSPTGRVGIFTLTKTMYFRRAHGGPCESSFAYAFRLDHILPFHSEEKVGNRPLVPLCGIATAPVQGTKEKDGRSRRWRLLLTYQDHSVVAYELVTYNRHKDGLQAVVV